MTKKEFSKVWQILTNGTNDKKESRIVRVNSLQGLYDLFLTKKDLKQDLKLTISQIEKENIPSINARIRSIKKLLVR